MALYIAGIDLGYSGCIALVSFSRGKPPYLMSWEVWGGGQGDGIIADYLSCWNDDSFNPFMAAMEEVVAIPGRNKIANSLTKKARVVKDTCRKLGIPLLEVGRQGERQVLEAVAQVRMGASPQMRTALDAHEHLRDCCGICSAAEAKLRAEKLEEKARKK